jgi:hypothetical protein
MIIKSNPTTVRYNGSAVNIYNATNRQASFENKNIFFSFEKKRSSLLQCWR